MSWSLAVGLVLVFSVEKVIRILSHYCDEVTRLGSLVRSKCTLLWRTCFFVGILSSWSCGGSPQDVGCVTSVVVMMRVVLTAGSVLVVCMLVLESICWYDFGFQGRKSDLDIVPYL